MSAAKSSAPFGRPKPVTGNKKERAYARMMELLGLTIADPHHHEGRRQERFPAPEDLVNVFQGDNVSGASFEEMQEALDDRQESSQL